MRNGWTATAGEDFIAIASTQSVTDRLSKDETVPSVIARMSGRFVCSSRSQSISIGRSGLIIAYKNTEAHPDPACQQLCDQWQKTCADLALCSVRLRAIAILVRDGENDRQTAIGAKKDRRTFRYQMRPVKSVLVGIRRSASSDSHSEIGKLRSRLHPATSGIEYIIPDETTHNSFIVNAIQRLQA